MIRDLERESPGPDEIASLPDVCIVGAGAAGIALAVELAQMGRRVVLLEAGGPEIEEASQDAYRSEIAGLTHRGIHTGRFRAHGGTTTKWGGQILELDAVDFERREGIAESGWPFAKHELERHYERALHLEGLSGVTREDAKVWQDLGLAEPVFPGMTSYLSRWCPQPNFAVLHKDALEGPSSKIAVWLHASAVEMQMQGEAIAGIRCRTLGGREFTFRAHHFVFCLGAIECTRFFLQPREGGLPWNVSGPLGSHFQDHIDVNAATVKPLNAAKFHATFDNIFLNGFKYHPKIKVKPEGWRYLNAGATMYFISDLDQQMDDLKSTAKKMLRGGVGQLGFGDVAKVAANLPLLARQAWRYKMSHRAYNPASAQVKLRVHCEQEPASASSITLSGERDAFGMLRTRLDWRISEFERETILNFTQVAAQALAGLAEVTLDPTMAEGGAAFRQRCDDSNHHMGGMRMASSDRQGVVDTDLRLFGTRNCYVCSGAVFPTSGFSNPTHTVLALAMRLAEHLNRG